MIALTRAGSDDEKLLVNPLYVTLVRQVHGGESHSSDARTYIELSTGTPIQVQETVETVAARIGGVT